MTVYFVFVPNNSGAPYPMRTEFTPNAAMPAWLLQDRARTRHSRTYYKGVVRGRSWAAASGPTNHQPTRDFPTADGTAFMLVWKRRAAQKPPTVEDAPDEIWTLSALGAVLKASADVETEPVKAPVRPAFPVRVVERRSEPAPVRLTYDGEGNETVLVVRQTVAPVRPVCQACGVMERPDGRCGCS
ncbi:hypothetical protein [Streptomyces albidoflavus]|uniref:hypothetical protein n=1 Tax=Streptomyces albidoflavus TaxID=1886 RepID=UPI0034011E1A